MSELKLSELKLSELKLYRIYEDGDGHKYLIPKDEYESFVCKLNQAEHKLDDYVMGTPPEDQDEDYVEELREAVWMCFDDYETIEGEEYYIVLARDLEEGIES